MTTKTFDVLGIPIAVMSMDEAVRLVLAAPGHGYRLSVHFATVHSITAAHDHDELRRSLLAGLVLPDGMPLVWLGRRRHRDVERICGPDFMPALVAAGVKHSRSHYFVGSTPSVVAQLVRTLSARFPGVDIRGWVCPPYGSWSDEQNAEYVARINRADPDYVWVGLGTPKQDIWILRNRPQIKAAAMLGVGAAFDFLAGTKRRAPQWMQASGLEWAFRLMSEPQRLAARYTVVNIRFAWLLANEALGRRGWG